MDFVKLNRYAHPSGAVFEPQTVVEKMKEKFPDSNILPGDQLALSAERAARLGAAGPVVEKLRKNAQTYGPAFALEIPIPGGGMVQARARRYDVTFLFDTNIPKNLRDVLISFLQSLGEGQLEMGTATNQQEIVSRK
jgi:hypothetical protein